MKTIGRNCSLPLLLATLALHCGRDADDRIYVTAIEVSNTTDRQLFNPSELLEIEVHLFESGTNRFIACSGEDNGMRQVDRSGVRYQLEARFTKPNGKDLLFQEVEPLQIRLEVFEDDFDACPQAPSSDNDLWDDDLVGASASFPGSELRHGKVMQFGNVTYLHLAKGKSGAKSLNAPAF